MGWGYIGEDTAENAILLLGGETQMSNSVKLLTENWIPLDADIANLSFAIRFFGEKLAADLGFISPVGSDMEGFPFIPMVNFVYNFR